MSYDQFRNSSFGGKLSYLLNLISFTINLLKPSEAYVHQ